ncbi:hypothetical protein [Cohnella faecalis]|uniref:hypothetical protein n=1 Tax=Cohnella faecalis TaxID=2315694 RepID=UPI0013141B5F|nr:hypothetical protein [Cohnella faecalis]
MRKRAILPAESEELTVLPPHFDVNIPMVYDTAGEAGQSRDCAAAEAYIDILFDRPIRAIGIGHAVCGRRPRDEYRRSRRMDARRSSERGRRGCLEACPVHPVGPHWRTAIRIRYRGWRRAELCGRSDG